MSCFFESSFCVGGESRNPSVCIASNVITSLLPVSNTEIQALPMMRMVSIANSGRSYSSVVLSSALVDKRQRVSAP